MIVPHRWGKAAPLLRLITSFTLLTMSLAPKEYPGGEWNLLVLPTGCDRLLAGIECQEK